MIARLVYLVDGQEIELEKMDLETLDSFTYSTFAREKDIVNYSKYEGLIGDLPKNGEVKIAYDSLDVCVETADYFAEFGFNPFRVPTYYLSVLVGEREIEPTNDGIKADIVGTLSDIDVAEEFYEVFRERFTPRERLLGGIDFLKGTHEFVFDGIKRVVDESLDHSDGYFVGRIFVDGLDNFESIKNKSQNGKKVYQKNK